VLAVDGYKQFILHLSWLSYDDFGDGRPKCDEETLIKEFLSPHLLEAHGGGPGMRRENLSKHLSGLFIFICVICIFPVFPPAAEGTTLADLAGTWEVNSFVTGPSAPWWLRGTITVATDGTFTSSGTQNDGKVDSGSGAFSISSNGILR
jgi:hypothetical protein